MWLLRALLPATAAAAVVVTASLLYEVGLYTQYYALAAGWGAAPYASPFLDIHGVTSAIECHRLGFDVFIDNVCDVFHRPHAYSPVWLWMAALPITTAWDNAFGIASVLMFLLALPFLPTGRGWWQTGVITLGTFSSTTMFALERGNIDLLVFALAVVVVRLRWAGYIVALLAGMLKFYPFALFVLTLRERPAQCIRIVLSVAGLVAVWFASDATAIMRGIANIPVMRPFDDNAFGARTLPFDVVAQAGLSQIVAWAGLVTGLALMVVIALALSSRVQLHLLTEAEVVSLMAGCALVVACFVLAQNVSYRGIYLLFALPALTALRWHRTIWLIMLLLWFSGLHHAINLSALRYHGTTKTAIWVVHELAWWTVATLLAALLLRWCREARCLQEWRKSKLKPT